MRLLLMVLLCNTACSRSDLGYFLGEPVEIGVVEDIYPDNGNWNDYVRRSDVERSWLSQPNVPCTGEELGLHSVCIHGGEKKEVVLHGAPSCEGLSAADELGAFRWVCRVRDGGAVTMATVGLHHDKGLAHLVTGAGFRPNSVRVYSNGEDIGATTATVWWDNSVVPTPPRDGALAVPLSEVGTVYVVDVTRTGAFSLEADRQAIVTLPGVTLQYHGDSAPNCDELTGEREPADRTCVVFAGDQQFQWIEVTVDAANARASEPVLLANARFTQVRHTTVANAGSNNFRFKANSFANFIYRTAVADCDDENSSLDDDSHDNVVYDFKSYNSDWQGMHLDPPAQRNILVRVLMTGNFEEGFKGLPGSVLSHVTLAANGLMGLDYTFGVGVVVQAASAGNAGQGVVSSVYDGQHIANLVAANNGGAAVDLAATGGHGFSGVLAIGANGDACIATGTEPGVDTTCGPTDVSTHVLRTGLDLRASFVGPIPERDPVNLSNDANGEAAYSADLDWFGFESWFRTWGNAAVELGPLVGGNCEDEMCGIWDWRVRRSDTVVRNKSGDGVNDNEPFVPGGPCPTAVNGDAFVLWSTRRFLINAVEIVLDSVGNDDGLCESNEACLYSPNLGGAYQGHGDWLSQGTCVFQDGQVRGVHMYAYPENGV